MSKKYRFTFSGSVDIVADSEEEAEKELVKLNQFELADNFTEFECTEVEQ